MGILNRLKKKQDIISQVLSLKQDPFLIRTLVKRVDFVANRHQCQIEEACTKVTKEVENILNEIKKAASR